MLRFLSGSTKRLAYIVLILTLLMVAFAVIFSINDYINHPQFEHFDNYKNIIAKIKSTNGKSLWFRLFFIVDYIWAPLLFFLAYKIIKLIKDSVYLKNVRIKGTKTFAVFAIFAYSFDAVENALYFSLNEGIGKLLSTIVGLKKIFYVLAFFVFIYHVFLRYVYPYKTTIYNFIKSSGISLFFIILILFLITGVGQGPTLIVDLLERPLNLLGIFFLLTFFALTISHYPIYLEIAQDKQSAYELEMETRRPLLGFGIVFAKRKNGSSDFRLKYLRRSLGTFLYVTFMYVVLQVASLYYGFSSRIPLLAFVLLLVLQIFYYRREKRRNMYNDIIYGTIKGDREAAAHKIIKMAKMFPVLWILSTLLSIVTALISALYGWCQATILATLVTLFINVMAYIYFRLTRSDLKYVFWSHDLELFNQGMYRSHDKKQLMEEVICKSNLKKGFFRSVAYKVGQRIAYLSDNRIFLKAMQKAGQASLIILLLMNFIPSYALHINAVNVIVLNIVVLYSIVIIYIKHVIFYSRYEEAKVSSTVNKESSFWVKRYKTYRDIFKYISPLLIIVIIAWANYSTSKGNDLHEIQVATKKVDINNQVSIDEYIENFIDLHLKNVKDTTTVTPIYFVGSYGGGLKANLWNLVLFEELQSRTDNKFFDHAICMSGVSGGTIGISNYTMLRKEAEDAEERKTRIDTIGVSNILASDLTLLMGRDFLREYIPIDDFFDGKDRSYYGMREHAKMSGMHDQKFGKYSFRDYWAKVYRAKGHHPAFIVNATSTQGKQGVALSLKHDNNENIFPGAETLLIEGDKDIAYYGAVSTTNRFPLLSPSARIADKGHFLDGGYFENSGLLSAKGFFDYLETENYLVKDSIQDKDGKLLYNLHHGDKNLRVKPVFINVINSQDYYVRQSIDDWDFTRGLENDVSEIASILETVASTEKTPRYITELIESEGFDVRKIMMPHNVTLDRVKAILKGDPKDLIDLMDSIRVHDSILKSVLESGASYKKGTYYHYDKKKWGIVEPPLARMLSTPARQYQKIMVHKHPVVAQEINKINSELNQ